MTDAIPVPRAQSYNQKNRRRRHDRQIEHRGSGPRVEWSQEAVAPPGERLPKLETTPVGYAREHAKSHECDDWLRAFLADRPRAAEEVFEFGAGAGFTKDQIRKAKHRLSAVTLKEGFAGTGQRNWRLNARGAGR